ncbi:RagB/SusD family nutrient uptake outer membrane protein [Sphingobacterium corticibacterium]|uniref:RagB/SusD family nutrient uptake outer membrane protein n=1 Tax=Sphingobacterium corticibacterium TaxID=2484746 RepID=A0A4Q6XYJ9_9SPHI|nr:RagB/SusD family nutrient uptake outer membrane protein [Sphingobacterium corticibacterium]RZF61636.1 RagB/SusD family nutrient uptake outer membrane protein [Sphingobacterium corticibacterium]
MKNIKKYFRGWTVLTLVCVFSSCSKYLDIVPDNIPEIDNAFTLRIEAQKFLMTCYSYLPRNGDNWYNAGFMTGDEIWLPQEDQARWHAAFRIAQGMQNTNDVLFDEWGGWNKGNMGDSDAAKRRYFQGLRNCNIFLSNIQRVPDITETERERWIGEVEFLKAYYHFYLMRMYGAVPIVDENIPENANPEDLRLKRAPFDECLHFVSNLLDEAVQKLPLTVSDENSELGRITKPIALAIKARLWLMAASPLFNGNPDYANYTDHDGIPLFNSTFDPSKWERAKDAAKEAIDAAEQSGASLYYYTNDIYNLSDVTKTQLNIRNAVTERFGQETIWGLSFSPFVNQAQCMPPMSRSTFTDRFAMQGVWSVPLKIVRQFYSKNGVPINEDKHLDFSNEFEVRIATDDERFNIEPGYHTARINFDREPRYYANLGFDGGIWYMRNDANQSSDVNTYYVQAKNTERAGFGHFENFSETGYFVKKLVNWRSTMHTGSNGQWLQYPWPEIRLAELYLTYAEALVESDGDRDEAIQYVDLVRARAGLHGIADSWTNHSRNPAKFTSKSGLLDIIRQERLIELTFEGQRLWDLRRWKFAADRLNENITGLNIQGRTADAYNIERVIHTQTFISPRDYLWPIKDWDLMRNPKLIQNPGW